MEQAAARVSVSPSRQEINGSAACDSDALPSASNGLQVSGLPHRPTRSQSAGLISTRCKAISPPMSPMRSGETHQRSAPYTEPPLSYIPEEPWNDSTSSNGDLAFNQLLGKPGSTDIIAAQAASAVA